MEALLMKSLTGWIAIVLSLSTVLLLGQGCPSIGPGDGGTPDGNGDGGLTGKYAGSQRCETCHLQIQNHWMDTLHADALTTLEDIGQDNNPDCLPCHTVGYGESGGFVSRETTKDLAGVGCESCHGPARDHVENVADETLRPTVSISSEVCGKCHTGEHQPQYDEWVTSAHASVTEHVAEYFTEGLRLSSCGECHSGYTFYNARLMGRTVADDALAGVGRRRPGTDGRGRVCDLSRSSHADRQRGCPGHGSRFPAPFL
jgi:hypothetical protein